LIVGAGPAGIALALRLRQRRISALVLEAHRIGETWHRVPREMRLVSPWWTNALRSRDVLRFPPLAKVLAEDFRNYLATLARRERLDIIEGAKISEIESVPGGWRARADDGRSWIAPQLVLATGYFGNPKGPIGGLDTDGSVPVSHVASVHDYDAFARDHEGQTVVIVGKRVSAGQFMTELARRGVRVVLATRGPVEFRRAGLAGWIRDHIYFFWEALRVRLQPGLRADSYPIMDGGETERMVRSRQVAVVGPVTAIRGGKVLCGDQSIAASHVLLATGYSAVIENLAIKPETMTFESGVLSGFRLAEGLYAIGIDQQTDFRSRYLRGIRVDARALAGIVDAEARPATSMD
jgi:glycine/D-amino acid oxidase-like deaminating enzyme